MQDKCELLDLFEEGLEQLYFSCFEFVQSPDLSLQSSAELLKKGKKLEEQDRAQLASTLFCTPMYARTCWEDSFGIKQTLATVTIQYNKQELAQVLTGKYPLKSEKTDTSSFDDINRRIDGVGLYDDDDDIGIRTYPHSRDESLLLLMLFIKRLPIRNLQKIDKLAESMSLSVADSLDLEIEGSRVQVTPIEYVLQSGICCNSYVNVPYQMRGLLEKVDANRQNVFGRTLTDLLRENEKSEREFDFMADFPLHRAKRANLPEGSLVKMKLPEHS